MGRINIAGAVAFLLLICVFSTVGSAAGARDIPVVEPYNSWIASGMKDNVPEGAPGADLKAHSAITVCHSGCDYTSIQAAIYGASAGDSILVSKGTYPESLVVNKSLDIRGINGTVLVGAPGQEYGADITSDMVELRNLTFTTAKENVIRIEGNLTLLAGLNLTAHDPDDNKAPAIVGSDIDGVFITRCQIATTGTTGISFGNASGVFVSNNAISTGEESGDLNTGIEVVQASVTVPASYIFLTENKVTNGGIGVTTKNNQGGLIVFPSLDKIGIWNNTITGSTYKGIDVGSFEDIDGGFHVTNVTISDNLIQGISSQFDNLRVRSVSTGEIMNNTILDFPVYGSGVTFSDLDKFTILNNSVSDGTVNWLTGQSGFLVEDVKNSVIRENTVCNVLPFAFDYAPADNFNPNLTFDQTNTADGRPVRFLESADNVEINGSSNPAMVVLLSCTNVTVRNATIHNSGLGIGIYGSEGTVVTGNVVQDTNNGMMLIDSCGSRIDGNDINTTWMGIGVGKNQQTRIADNSFSHYKDAGIVLHLSDSSINITRNTFTGDFIGTDQAIAMNEADGNSVLITDNAITHSSRGVLMLQSANFTLSGNEITDSGIGFNLVGAQNNVFSGNRILNDDAFSEGLYVISSPVLGGGVSTNNQFVNNYVQSVRPVNVSTVTNASQYARILESSRWGPEIAPPSLIPSGELTFPNAWNTTKITGKNIVNGSYLGGNYYATPTGSGWSQTHPDRGDGFVTEPYVFDEDNIDSLPLHMQGTPTPTPTPSPTSTYTPTPTPTPLYISANFSGSPLSGTPPLQVQFADRSSGNPTSWSWMFGDGSTSREQNPVHVYTGIGRYTVTLEVANAQGQSILRKPSYVTPNAGRVTGPNGMIWITSSPTSAQVYADGVFIGETPLQSKGIPAGIHQIRVSSEGYRSWIGYVQVSQGVFSYVPKVILRR